MAHRTILIRLLPLLLSTGVVTACDDGKKADAAKPAKEEPKEAPKAAADDAGVDAKADDASAQDAAAGADANAEEDTAAGTKAEGDKAEGDKAEGDKAEGDDDEAEEEEDDDEGEDDGDDKAEDTKAEDTKAEDTKAEDTKTVVKKPPAEPKTTPTADNGSAAAKIDAADLYSKKCKSCHNSNGDAKTKLGEKHDIDDWTVAGWKAKWPKSKIVAIVTDGKSGTKMKSFKDKMSKDEIDAVSAYAFKLGK